MAIVRKFYLILNQDKNCCVYRFSRFVKRVAEFTTTFPTETNAEAGYILVNNRVSVDGGFFDGFDGVWKIVEEKNFDKSNLVVKTLSAVCGECLRRYKLLREGKSPDE